LDACPVCKASQYKIRRDGLGDVEGEERPSRKKIPVTFSGNDDNSKVNHEPKRHIALPGKRNIVRIEDKSDMSCDYQRDDRIPPFKVNKDPSIFLNNEDTPWLRDDHNQGSYVKKKFTVVPT